MAMEFSSQDRELVEGKMTGEEDMRTGEHDPDRIKVTQHRPPSAALQSVGSSLSPLDSAGGQDYKCAELCEPCGMLFSGHWIRERDMSDGCSIGTNPPSGSPHFDIFDGLRCVRAVSPEARSFQPVQHHTPIDLWDSTPDCYLCLSLQRLLRRFVGYRPSKALVAFVWLAEHDRHGQLMLRYAFYAKDELNGSLDRYGALDMEFLTVKASCVA
jgi:hypothetical protein